MPYFYEKNIALLDGSDFAQTVGSMPKSIAVGPSLYATSSIGVKRRKQEDAVLLAQHPNNQAFKLLAVADGLGGSEDGAKASSNAVRLLANSFTQISAQKFYEPDINIITNVLRDIINDINNQIYSHYNGQSLTTLVCALVCQNKTFIANIGDSRAYAVRDDGYFGLITQDDSDIFNRLITIKQQPIDDVRFHRESNVMNRCLGQVPNIKDAFNVYIVNTERYSKLLLCSDGVSDCLSARAIEVIMKQNKNDAISSGIVSAAIDPRNISYVPEHLDEREYFEMILPGKDNTTAAVFARK